VSDKDISFEYWVFKLKNIHSNKLCTNLSILNHSALYEKQERD